MNEGSYSGTSLGCRRVKSAEAVETGSVFGETEPPISSTLPHTHLGSVGR